MSVLMTGMTAWLCACMMASVMSTMLLNTTATPRMAMSFVASVRFAPV